MMWDWLGYVLIMAGCLVVLFATFRAVCADEFWRQIHILSVLDVFALLLVGCGLMVLLGWSAAALKVLVLVLVVVFLSPFNAYLLVQLYRRHTVQNKDQSEDGDA